MSSIKDAATRLAAQNRGALSFAINTRNGEAYKILKINNSEEKYIIKIEYTELNHFLEMNSQAFDKYKKITEDNWQHI